MSVIAYHFVGDTLRDGRPVPSDGEWLVHDEPVVICKSGLHASRRPWHALKFAPGATLCRVECDGIAEEHDDKLVCSRRRIIARIDATDLLRRFARDEARRVLHLWGAPDVVRRYLETGDESIRAAAWDAARAAARDAAWAAARGAARGAALDAAGERFDALVEAAFDALAEREVRDE